MDVQSTKQVLFLIAGGGFQWESLSLARQVQDVWSCQYVVPDVSVFPGSSVMESIEGRPYFIVPEFSSRADSRLPRILKNLWRGIGLLWTEFNRSKPAAAVCVGSSMSIPIALVCRLRGVPFIFVESITRTDSLSSTGKLLLRLRAVSYYFVQWPEQEQLHTRVQYGGTVL